MSGKKTDNFSANLDELMKSVMKDSSPGKESHLKKVKTNPPKKRINVPLSFKLKLIAEVKKHEIIWQDIKEKKNSDLVEGAWNRVRKALSIKKTGFCESHWKLLIIGYRKNINRGTPMNMDLIQDMGFMYPQLKKSSPDESSDTEPMKGDTPVKTVKTPKRKKSKSISSSDDYLEAHKASVAIVSLLTQSLPPDVTQHVLNTLVTLLIKVMPQVESQISEHAKQQISRSGNVNNVDWSALDIPDEICRAVWEYKVMQKLLKD